MKDDLVSIEIAKLAKVKGFNEPCMHYIWSDSKLPHPMSVIQSSNKGRPCKQEEWWEQPQKGERVYTIAIPTLSLLQRWLRENHYIYISIEIEVIGSDEWEYAYRIKWLPKEHENAKRRAGHMEEHYSYYEGPGSYVGAWYTHEEALEEAIKYSLKNIL